MIYFIYGFNYDSSGSDQGRNSAMLFNVKVYQIGDKYDIPKLKEQSREKFSIAIETCWEMDDFPIAIASAYSTTTSADRGLRDPLVSTSLKHIDVLLKKKDFKQVLRDTVMMMMMISFTLSPRQGDMQATTTIYIHVCTCRVFHFLKTNLEPCHDL
jgi:hypothetical protein